MRNVLAACRQDAGWSQSELGARVGVSRQTINAIERGRYDPSLPLAFKLARLFGCSIEDLFDDGAHHAEGDTHARQERPPPCVGQAVAK